MHGHGQGQENDESENYSQPPRSLAYGDGTLEAARSLTTGMRAPVVQDGEFHTLEGAQ